MKNCVGKWIPGVNNNEVKRQVRNASPITPFGFFFIFIKRYQVKEEPWDGGITSRLVIITTEKQDAGNYSCLVENQYGEDKTNIQLIVQGKYLQKPRPNTSNIFA